MKKVIAVILAIVMVCSLSACGVGQLDEIYCSNCGEVVAKNTPFCGYCGTAVNDTQSDSNDTSKDDVSSAQREETEYYETFISTINAGVLTVGVCADIYPYEYIDNFGNFAGAEVEMLEAIAKEIGLQIEFDDMTFDELWGALTDGQVDCIMGCLDYVSVREQFYNASNAMYTQYFEYDSEQCELHSTIYIDKSNRTLTKKINNAIDKLQKDGTFKAILDKYDIQYSF